MDDKDNIRLIRQALKDYRNGAVIEVCDALEIVTNRILDFCKEEEFE